jgi:2-polyprenyl-6-methoxyphenol hydroxylase-like FAD-dependent oxidoreductase
MKFPSRESFGVVPVDLKSKRGGVILEQENNRWIVTLIGYFGEHAPEDMEGFMEFARSLPSRKIYESLIDAEPISEPRTFKFPSSTRRYYERVKRLPTGLIAFGDAICSFNPVYGQGMSCAALQAAALQKCLKCNGANFERHFFRAAAKVIDIPWGTAVGSDLRLAETVGKRTLNVRFINWYVAQLHKAGHTDAVAAAAFLRVAQLVAPPTGIFAPTIAARIIRNIIYPAKIGSQGSALSARYSLNFPRDGARGR